MHRPTIKHLYNHTTRLHNRFTQSCKRYIHNNNIIKQSTIKQQSHTTSYQYIPLIACILGSTVLIYYTFQYNLYVYADANATPYPNTANIGTHIHDHPEHLVTAHKSKSGIDKPRLVIIGTGWASVGLLKHLDIDAYDIHIISPRNYVLFTPLLPSATTGTVEMRSLAEPIRAILRRFKHMNAQYYQSKAIDVDFDNKRVLCYDKDSGDEYYVPYDHLVIACGSRNNSFNTPGVKEYTHYLKEIKHARAIRLQLIHNLEHAALPCVKDQERDSLLHCVVVGGGPTGVEFAAELSDFLHDEISRQFPELVKHVKVTLIQSQDHILNTYDEKISQYAEREFEKQDINLITGARVNRVNQSSVVYTDKKTKQTIEIPFGLCVWSTGIQLGKLATLIRDKLDVQKNQRQLVTDNRLRLLGVDYDTVYALGDTATTQFPQLKDKAERLFHQADINNDGCLDMHEFSVLCEQAVQQVPSLASYFHKAHKKFNEYDCNHDHVLSLDEFKTFLADAEKSYKAYPATAQVAEQQGHYLAERLNSLAKVDYNSAQLQSLDKPFVYKHFANLAYVGREHSAIDFGSGKYVSGLGAFWLWKSIYLSTSVSMRTRVALGLDWSKSFFFGRNTSQY